MLRGAEPPWHLLVPDTAAAAPAHTGWRHHSTDRLTFCARKNTFNHMVDLSAPELDTIFQALGDATRRQMLVHLSGGARTVSELAEPFEISLAAASKHIKVLERAGLLQREIRGRTHICRLDPGPLASAHRWLGVYEQFWTTSLDTLEALLRAEDAEKAKTSKGEGQ